MGNIQSVMGEVDETVREAVEAVVLDTVKILCSNLMIPVRAQITEAASLKVERDAALDVLKKLRLERVKMQRSIDSLERKEKELTGVRGKIREIRKPIDELTLMRKEDAKNKRKMEEMHERSLKQALQDCKRVRKICRLVELKKSSLASQLASAESRLREVECEKLNLAGQLASTERVKNELQVIHEKCRLILSEEKEKRLCEICIQSPKDSVCLPCLHLRYCFKCLEQHRQLSRTCPFCGVLLNGVIRSDLSMFND